MPFRLYRPSGSGHVNAADSAMDLDEVLRSLYEYVTLNILQLYPPGAKAGVYIECLYICTLNILQL